MSVKSVELKTEITRNRKSFARQVEEDIECTVEIFAHATYSDEEGDWNIQIDSCVENELETDLSEEEEVRVMVLLCEQLAPAIDAAEQAQSEWVAQIIRDARS